MAGVDKVNVNPILPISSQTENKTQRGKRGDASFIKQLTGTPKVTAVPKKAEDEQSQTQFAQDDWLKQRTIEELKTVIQAYQAGITDPWKLTDLIFYARHPEMEGKPMTSEHQDLLDEWNAISALLVHPTLNEIGNFIGTNVFDADFNETKKIESAFSEASKFRINTGGLSQFTTRYDEIIANAVQQCPGLAPAILKSLLAQESRFNPTVINKYGYAGIAQFGRPAAREVGLYVGIAGSATDERLNPAKAIPGAARLLTIKAQRLASSAFSRYGQPEGIEFWKFVLAAYNGGEGTVSLAMGHAYRSGLEMARSQGMVGMEAVSFARRYASKWENLKVGGTSSPLGLAAARYFPSLATSKYHEIGNYPTEIVARVAKG